MINVSHKNLSVKINSCILCQSFNEDKSLKYISFFLQSILCFEHILMNSFSSVPNAISTGANCGEYLGIK